MAGKHRVPKKRGAQSNVQEWKRCNTDRLPPSDEKRSSRSDGRESNASRGNTIPAPTNSHGCQKEEKDAYQTKSKGRENQNLVAGRAEEEGVCRGSNAGNERFQSGNSGRVLEQAEGYSPEGSDIKVRKNNRNSEEGRKDIVVVRRNPESHPEEKDHIQEVASS